MLEDRCSAIEHVSLIVSQNPFHVDHLRSVRRGAPPKPVLLGWGSSTNRAQKRYADLLSATCSPLRFNFHYTGFARQVVSKTTPGPILWILYEAPSDRISVHVAELLGAFLLRPDIEVVVALLPEMFVGTDKSSGDRLLKRLNRCSQCAASRLAHKQMHVFRHDDISRDKELITEPRSFESNLEEVSATMKAEQRLAPVAAEGDEVEVTCVLVALETPWHL